MRKIVFASTALLIAVLGSQTARADWAWTRWGMNTSEVLLASGGAADFTNDEERKRRMYRRGFTAIRVPELVADHRLGGEMFNAYLLFEPASARLVCVDLIPKNGGAAPALKAALVAAYGSPQHEKREQLPGIEWTTTNWSTDRDTIELQQGGVGTKLQFCQHGKVPPRAS